jgi:hypothetical protein
MVKKLGVLAPLVALAALAPGLVASCGPSASSYPVERTNHACLPGVCPQAVAPATGDAGIGNEPLEPWPDESAGLLSGIYALHALETANILGISVTLQLLYRLRLLQETSGAGNVLQSMTLCALRLPSVKNIATLSLPTRLQALIPVKSAVVSRGNFISSEGGLQTYSPPPLLLVIGARLENPATDPLPSLMDASTEWDEDMDGHPGVTVNATVFTCTSAQELYVAIRTGGTITGTFTGFDTLDGTMNIKESESVVGYSDPCLSAATEVNPELNPMTTFHAQRLADEQDLDAKGNVSCADIIAEAPKLYGSAWTDP